MKARAGRAMLVAQRRVRNLPRKAFLAAARRLTPALVVEHAAGLFVVPSDDLTVRPKLFLNGWRSEFVVLERAVRCVRDDGRHVAGGAIVDVGANLGTTTLAALRLHGFARAVACEPDPRNAAFLRSTVAINGLDDAVVVVEAALADVPGRASFAVRPLAREGWLSGVGVVRVGATPEAGEVDVAVTTLDELVSRGVVDPGGTSLVWVDAQGHEGFVLAGARALLENRVPFVTAVRRKRLAKAGGLQRFREVAGASFASFVDLRRPNLKAEWTPQRRPIDELQSVVDAPRSTDVLLLP